MYPLYCFCLIPPGLAQSHAHGRCPLKPIRWRGVELTKHISTCAHLSFRNVGEMTDEGWSHWSTGEPLSPKCAGSDQVSCHPQDDVYWCAGTHLHLGRRCEELLVWNALPRGHLLEHGASQAPSQGPENSGLSTHHGWF